MGEKRFFSALSTKKDWREAVSDVAAEVRRGLGAECDLAVLFATELYPDLEPGALPGLIREALPCRALLGCSTSGVIGGEREVEMEPAVALLGMSLPGVKVAPFYLSPADVESAQGAPELIGALDVFPTEKPKFLSFSDPMTCDIEKWLSLFNAAYPGAPIIGGLASGPAVGRPNWLLSGGEAYREGSVGVALSGPVEFEIVVAQGCRPIGAPLTVTKAEGNVLSGLGGRPPLEVLRELLGTLSQEDQHLARHSLFAGLVMNEKRAAFARGDFLIRNLMGFDPESGALMVGASLRAGQTLQFQLRDARTSAEDLQALLGTLSAPGGSPRGALLVSCCGRGKGLYGSPDHDSRLIQKMNGPLPLAGFFANGEIGPVGSRNYIHGYTSSLAVIR